jgi:ABC-2 type transport system ATP-binding protein
MSTPILAISIRGLKKSFKTSFRRRRSQALRGLDLDVAQGEVFGFLGPNGAGKTTTIKILVGLLCPDHGQASIFGQPVSDVGVRRRIAYLPELPDFYDYLTPTEFLFHCGRLSGVDAHTLAARVPELIAKVGLDPNERRQMRKFSKGMLQRVGIAQTLLADPDLYIFDEPQTGLDPIGRRWVKDLILDLGRSGKTVFFSSHILAEVEAVCDRVAFLTNGRLAAQGSLDQVLKTETGVWEILVEGQAARADQSLAQLCMSIRESGPDTILSLPQQARPEALLPHLIERGYRLRSVMQQHTSLEDVFLQALASDSSSEKTG